MDLRALRYFVLVAEEGSVHGGARRAMVAQPALSVALKKLEREVGAPLFERSFRGVTLTPAGSVLLRRARHILRYTEDARAEAGLAGPEGPPTFTVGLVEGLAAALEITGPILQTFQRRNPDVRLEVRELNFIEQFDCVLDRSVDVAIVRAPYEHPELQMDPLFREPSLLVASPDHPLGRLREVSVESVLGEPMLEVVRTPRPWREFWDLAELRNEKSRFIPSSAVTLVDYMMDVLRNSVVSPLSQGAWRLAGLGDQTLRPIRLVDAPYSVAGVGYLREDQSAKVQAFVTVAQTITEQLVWLIPDAELAFSRD